MRTLLLCAGAAVPAVPAVAQCPDGTPPPCRGARTAAAPAANSVAVLYFDNASSNTADVYLADGITEEIISRLGEVGRLRVKSRYLVRRYRGGSSESPQAIGRQLAVASIVTGSVRRAGNRLRVTAEMVRTATGDVMWSERYDRADSDMLSLQEDLARAVATAITGRLLPAERQAIAAQPTRDVAAWDHFLRGNAYLAQRTPWGYAHALTEYEAAARRDPGFSRALARVSYVYGVAAWRGDLVNGLPPDSSWRRARAAAAAAVRADGVLSDSWMALGLAQVQRPESVAVARASLERALALDSGSAEAVHVYGWALFYQGRNAEALAAWQRTLAIEPGRPITIAVLAWFSAVQHRWAEAERWADSAIALDRGFAQAIRLRAYARLNRGDSAGARADFVLLAGLSGNPLIEGIGRGLVAARFGDGTALRAQIASLPSMPDSLDDFHIGLVAAGLVELDEPDRALDWLERTRWKNTNFYANMLLWPYDRMRGHPRYERLLDESRVPAGAR